jgi:uncharacterized protein (DUF1778 family)
VQAVWVPDRPRRERTLQIELDALRTELEDKLDDELGSLALITNYAEVFTEPGGLPGLGGPEQVALLGPDWISARIDARAELRLALPSVLSLGAPGRWLHDELRARCTLDVGGAQSLAEVFVVTGAYRRALEVLHRHHFAVLTGPPEMGKTSIARMIALALMSDGWEAYECTTPEQIFAVFAAGRRQVFVADDAFGSTEYRPEAAERWAREMEGLLRMMDDRHWLIWTSRPAPLRAGLRRIHHERGAEQFPQPGAVLVDASNLSLDEKVLILLRHAKLRIRAEFRLRLRQVGYAIVSHPHFTPERIRRLLTTQDYALAESDPGALERVIERHIQTPTAAMAASLDALSEEQRTLLFALLDAPPGPVEERELARLTRTHHPGGLSRSPMELVDRLTDHFLRVTETLKVDWVHPSWRDLVIETVRRDAPTRERFLARCTLEGVMLAISSGGGAAGERALALLVSDRDWDLVTDQIVRIIGAGSDQEVARLLYGLADSLATAALSARQRLELQALAGTTLDATSRRCDRESRSIELDLIEAWFALSRRTGGEHAPPGLDRTWTELLPGEAGADAIPAELDQALLWLTLVDVMRVNAPEQLRAYGFPDRHRERIAAVVQQIAGGAAGPDRPRLAELLRLCRISAPQSREDLDRFDSLIWTAEQSERLTADQVDYSDLSARRHVEGILDDL